MITSADRARAGAFLDRFVAAGAVRVEPPVLLDAGPLLDLYGEDIRARAFTAQDPLRGEAMLRPDFTVPLVQAHMAEGAAPARYAYAGEVFRRQETDAARPREYLQAGLEVIGGDDAAAAEAEVFAILSDALAPWAPAPATGDIGLLIAAVASLDTTEARRAALRRHVPRPRRFRRLMERYTGRAAPRPAPEPSEAPVLGLRGADEIAARLDRLAAEAATPPIAAAQAEALSALLDLSMPLASAPAALHTLAGDLPGLAPAVARLEARVDALAGRGLDPAALPFAPAAGRTAMEYYDGFTFTFGLGAETVATGGRYDALTAALGGGATLPAVGGVIRPGLLGDAP